MNLETLYEHFPLIRQFGVPGGRRWATGTINGAADSNTYFNITGLTFPPGFVAYYTSSLGNIDFGIANQAGGINGDKNNLVNNIQGTLTNSSYVGYSPAVSFGSSYVNGLPKPGNQVGTIKWIALEGSI